MNSKFDIVFKVVILEIFSKQWFWYPCEIIISIIIRMFYFYVGNLGIPFTENPLK